jgi:hypothetical protein
VVSLMHNCLLTFNHNYLLSLTIISNKGPDMKFLAWRGVKLYVKIFCALLAFSFFSYLFAMKYANFIAVFVISCFVLVVVALGILQRLYSFRKWKSKVDDYVRPCMAYNLLTARLSSLFIELTRDDQIDILRWENIAHLSISKRHLTLINPAGTTFLIPTVNMSQDTRHQVTEFIKDRIKSAEIKK